MKRCGLTVIRVATCSPHDARRSFVSDLLDAGADVAAVRQLADDHPLRSPWRGD
ncbi:MAG: hypothetical protein ACYCW6_25435 [Candidatus Xenobia bacterium]